MAARRRAVEYRSEQVWGTLPVVHVSVGGRQADGHQPPGNIPQGDDPASPSQPIAAIGPPTPDRNMHHRQIPPDLLGAVLERPSSDRHRPSRTVCALQFHVALAALGEYGLWRCCAEALVRRSVSTKTTLMSRNSRSQLASYATDVLLGGGQPSVALSAMAVMMFEDLLLTDPCGQDLVMVTSPRSSRAIDAVGLGM